jgi:hypothetical protein
MQAWCPGLYRLGSLLSTYAADDGDCRHRTASAALLPAPAAGLCSSASIAARPPRPPPRRRRAAQQAELTFETAAAAIRRLKSEKGSTGVLYQNPLVPEKQSAAAEIERRLVVFPRQWMGGL